jgi:hypothetical protein
MSLSIIRAPEGMSYVNVVCALLEHSKRENHALLLTLKEELCHEDCYDTPEKICLLFKTRTYFDYIGGRKFMTDLSKFPIIDARLYDGNYGLGAAQKAIEQYNRKNSWQKCDPHNTYKFEDLNKW